MKPNTSPPAHSDSDDDSIDIPRGRSSTAVTEEGVVYRTASHVSGPDAIEAADPHHDDDHGDDASGSKPRSRSRSRSGGRDPYREAGDEVYERHSRWRKVCIVGVLSFCAFLSPISSTSVLSATPEVAATYGTTGSIINLSNAGYMALMAVSPVIWGPISQVFGRRPITILTSVAFTLLSMATGLAPNLASFFVFRALSAFEGTAFLLIGSACISDIYKPTERGTAIGWFMSGTLFGPAFGPFLGGIIVTYSSWRSIFWLQTALAGAGLVGVVVVVPETIHRKGLADLATLKTRRRQAAAVARMVNPWRSLRWYRHLNVALVAGASSALVWNMYSLLTPIRYVLNPRFGLESPLLSGLFYLAPGCGYLLGTFGGGHWADRTVKRWIRRRSGRRVPEDRLRSALPFIALLMPACILVYGWAVDQEVGGIALPVVAMFVQGVGQLFCFPSLNTYCLDVQRERGAEVAAANFFVRYLAGCVATAVVLPIVDAVGIGWFSTISAALLVVSAAGLYLAIWRGDDWIAREAARQARQKALSSSGALGDAEEEAGPCADEEKAVGVRDAATANVTAGSEKRV